MDWPARRAGRVCDFEHRRVHPGICAPRAIANGAYRGLTPQPYYVRFTRRCSMVGRGEMRFFDQNGL